jgi:hypothetical protein
VTVGAFRIQRIDGKGLGDERVGRAEAQAIWVKCSHVGLDVSSGRPVCSQVFRPTSSSPEGETDAAHAARRHRRRRRGPARAGKLFFLHVYWGLRVCQGDEITTEVEVFEVREDKPLTRLRTTIWNQDETVVVEGSVLVWTEPL